LGYKGDGGLRINCDQIIPLPTPFHLKRLAEDATWRKRTHCAGCNSQRHERVRLAKAAAAAQAAETSATEDFSARSVADHSVDIILTSTVAASSPVVPAVAAEAIKEADLANEALPTERIPRTTQSSDKLQRAAAFAAARAEVLFTANGRNYGAAVRAAAVASLSPDMASFVVAHVSKQTFSSRSKIDRRKQDKLDT